MNHPVAGRVSTLAGLAILVFLDGCSDRAPVSSAAPPQLSERTESASSVALANPASANCLQQGGRLHIEKTPRGDEYGVCLFEDNYQCEEWALMRGECRAGGVRVTGYITAAGRFCAITGGKYTGIAGVDASTERGICKLPGGTECDAEAYFSGDCRP
ncbi:DUF333 domain-containing protein [Povalibacter sp.]|uniref:putative hemolysin n=1 Tax=Povalibacter sp. TaxID=1962978 RepID=UPI002F40219D